ncbi:MAG: 16S rRNA (adenine(1518)-N(6)/adenine(1519)-N(6))-dimethyltransferase RsmA [Alphaproteobacteria bacterium]|nr:16S rRNA (adenine(1518)-N(6)/adenine(1519)-N(6))-dimethyltransferase RsmA [Alphaproteobacteria bacterium]
MSGNNFSLPSLREVIESHGLLAKKSLGQNFLLNMDVTRRIVKAAGNLEDLTVLEIGPGPGGLTRALLEAKAQVVAIERDHRCVEILRDLQLAYLRGSGESAQKMLSLIEGDALKISPQSIIPVGAIKIVANLPYNIGTPLLIQWLSNLDRIVSLTLMFQKEVALRLIAKPRTKSYGRLSILIQWLCEAQRLFDLSPKAFMPAPKVTSSVVHLVPRPLTPQNKLLFPFMERVTHQAFGQRRKMIRSSLKMLFLESQLIELGLDPCVRAEELTVADFVLLAKSLSMTTPPT